MFTNVDQAIDWITHRRKSEHPFSRFQQYMEEKGNPQLKLKCIHVAGTNGKGSTTNYLRSILQQAGYKVGSFTSPHLITHLDRIRINDENIDEQYFLDIINKNQTEFEANDLSMFEIDMYISAQYFLDNNVDFVVYEVGLGGRLDATNVISPLAAVITNIEMDHMAILGDTFAKIAFEKAGIIKENIPVVTFEKKKEVLDVFAETCEKKHAQLILTGEPENVEISDHIEYDYQGHHVYLPTLASYQILNSSAAITLIDLLNKKGIIQVSENQLFDGLQTIWKGRFETVSLQPKVIIDGAHNENGIDQLCCSIENLHCDCVIIFSALKDKNYHQMLGKLLNYGEVVVTRFENYRSSDSAASLALGYDVKVIEDYQKAIEYGLNSGKTVIITGSLYFISIVREMFLNHK